MALIEIENLVKSYRIFQKKEGIREAVRGLFHREYREVQAAQGINLKVEQGEFVAFLGPNGAGKTTTLKLLSGVIYPTSGTAQVMGYVPWERNNDYRRRFALVMGQKEPALVGPARRKNPFGYINRSIGSNRPTLIGRWQNSPIFSPASHC